MTEKTIGRLKTALMIGSAACLLALSAQVSAGMHNNGGMHSSMGTHSVSTPPPNMSPPSSGAGGGSVGSTGAQTGGHDHHRTVIFIHDPFFFDPFWWPPYPYTVETRYVEVPVSDGYWYYCPNSKMYYPYVKECASKWERVPPKPPTE